VLTLVGDWTSAGLGRLPTRLTREAAEVQGEVKLDFSGLGRFDTSGAVALNQAVAGRQVQADFEARPDVRRLVDLVAAAEPRERTRARRQSPLVHLLARMGMGVSDFGKQLYQNAVFNGRLATTLGAALVKPRRLRWASIVNQMDSTGLDALPIIATLSFFVGRGDRLPGRGPAGPVRRHHLHRRADRHRRAARVRRAADRHPAAGRSASSYAAPSAP
jgi:phospholipid/cholesterol/gamma-HCH transport system permease protein